jgi:hypothetical protein
MASYTTNYNLIKPANEDFIDIGNLNDNADAIDAAILAEKEAVQEWAKGAFSNFNLLRNGNFSDPVNQKGQTAYSSIAYTIDNWYLASSNSSLTVNSGYITLTSSTGGGYGRLQQKIENPELLKGKTVTLSFLVKGHYAITLYADDYLGYKTGTNADFEVVETTIDMPSTITTCYVELRGYNDVPADFKYAKKELSIVATSLTPKNYQDELKTNQYYYLPLNQYAKLRAGEVSANYIDFTIGLSSPMRIVPTLTAANMAVKTVAGVAQTGFTFTVLYELLTSQLVIRASKTSHGLTDASLTIGSGATLTATL